MAHRCPRPSCTCRGCASLAASSTGTTEHPGRVHDNRGDDSDRQPGLHPGQPALPAGRLPGRADRRDHDDKEDEKEGVDVVTNRVRENRQAATRAATPLYSARSARTAPSGLASSNRATGQVQTAPLDPPDSPRSGADGEDRDGAGDQLQECASVRPDEEDPVMKWQDDARTQIVHRVSLGG